MKSSKKARYWAIGLCSSFLLLSSCGDTNEYKHKETCTVDFALNTPDGLLTTEHHSQVVSYNGLVEKPLVTVTSDNPNNYRIEGWYTDSAYSADNLWDFDIYPVKDDMTLYAKWTMMYSVKFYLEGDYETPVYETSVKPGRCVNNCDDKVAGYKIDGYYTSNTFESDKVFDFATPINSHTSLYLKTDGLLYFSASTMKKNFSVVSASISGSTAGTATLVSNNNEEALSVNFGYSAKAANGNSDPHLLFSGGKISVLKSQVVKVKMKNLGPAKQIGFYFVGKDQDGNYVGGDDFNSTNTLYYNFKSNEMNMGENDEWIDVEFDLAKSTENWAKIDTLTKIRIESTYASKDSKDTTNVFLIKEIHSENVPEYDARNPKVSFYVGDKVVYSTRVNKGSALSEELCESLCAGYKVKGFYADKTKTTAYDFSNALTEDVSIYLEYEDTFYFDGKAIAKRFDAAASSDPGNKGFAPSKGTISYNEEYDGADVNFGISTLGDPYIYIAESYILRSGKNKIDVTLKNLGNCTQLAFYWAGVTKTGSEVKDFAAGYEYWSNPILSTGMKMEDEYATYTFDLSSCENWLAMEAITKFRFQAAYTSTSKEDMSNRMLIKSIVGGVL